MAEGAEAGVLLNLDPEVSRLGVLAEASRVEVKGLTEILEGAGGLAEGGALSGRGEFCCGRSPGAPLCSTPGYHIAGFQPWDLVWDWLCSFR